MTTQHLIDQIRLRVPVYQGNEHNQGNKQNQGKPQAAVLMAFTDDNETPELVLTRRSAQLNSHAGEVAFPGGKRDETDPDLAFTVLRESEEEIALPPSAVELVGAMPSAVSRWGLQVTPFVGIIPHQVDLVANEAEIETIFRVPLSYFLQSPQVEYRVRRDKGVDYRIPGFRFNDKLIWGLTAHFIAEFCNQVFDADFEYFRPTPVTTT